MKKNSDIIWLDDYGEEILHHIPTDMSLSYIGMDEAQQVFRVSFDQIKIPKVVEMVNRLLLAQNYVINLENFLACLDHLSFTQRLRLGPGGQPEAKIDVIEVRMPHERSNGLLLDVFYDEIQKYSDHIQELSQAEKRSSEFEALKQKLTALQAENQMLRLDLAEALGQKSEALLSPEPGVSHVQEDAPQNIRSGTLLRVNSSERVLQIKTDMGSLRLPIIAVGALGARGAPCLVFFEDGVAKRAFLYGDKAQPLESVIAEVLYKDADTVKVRDSLRNEWCLTALNDLERQELVGLKRGMPLLLFLSVERKAVLGFRQLTPFTGQDKMHILQGEIAKHLLNP